MEAPMSSNVEIKHSVCKHIRNGELERHSVIHWTTAPEENNRTDYRWDIRLELCPLCSGAAYAKMSMILNQLQDLRELIGAE